MGKIKRKHRMSYTSPLSSASSFSSSESPFSSSSCSSASPSPSPPFWPTSTQFAVSDEESRFVDTESNANYTPSKLARFNAINGGSGSNTVSQQATISNQQHQQQQQQQQQHQYYHNGMVKTQLTKKTTTPTGQHHFVSPVGNSNTTGHLSLVSPTNTFNNSLRARNTIHSNVMLPAKRIMNQTNQNGGNSINNRIVPSTYPSRSKNAKYELKILSQPEEQHRARYLTEGSRGAIKDRSGHGYPVVKLCGPVKQTVKVQCFIGHDRQIGTPHLFYQASKIAGKNSTTCFIKKTEGTSIITMELSPANNMEVTVDCIGILKERNVDVEQKLNKFQRSVGSSSTDTQTVANIKRSTRCRLVFRCEIPETSEILQVVSSPILCTQPLGTPEINKKSLSHCHINGGEELFIIGKNFLKDAKVIFRNEKWIKMVEPNREYFKSTHLICKIPPYDMPVPKGSSIKQCPVVEVLLMVKSGGKSSDPHRFYYHPCRDNKCYNGGNCSSSNSNSNSTAVNSNANGARGSLSSSNVNQLNDDSDNSMFDIMETGNKPMNNKANTDNRNEFGSSVHHFSFLKKLNCSKSVKNPDLIRAASMSHMSSSMFALVNSKSLDSIPTITSSATSTMPLVCESSRSVSVLPSPEVHVLSDTTNMVTSNSIHQTTETHFIDGNSSTTPAATVSSTSATTKSLMELTNSDKSNQSNLFTTSCLINDQSQPSVLNQSDTLANNPNTAMNPLVTFLATQDTARMSTIKQEDMVDSSSIILHIPNNVTNTVMATGQRLAECPTVTMQSNEFINNPLIVNSVNHSLNTEADKTFAMAYASNLVATTASHDDASMHSILCDANQNSILNDMQPYNKLKGDEVTSMNTSPMSYANIGHNVQEKISIKNEIIDESSNILAEISLSEINKQLSISSISNDMSMDGSLMPVNTVLNQSVFVEQTSPERNPMQSMVSTMIPSDISNANTSPSSASIIESASTSPLSTENVLMNVNPYALSPETKCSNSILSTDYNMMTSSGQQDTSIGVNLVNMHSTDYITSTNMDTENTNQYNTNQITSMNCEMSTESQLNSQTTSIETFIQNLTNDSIISSTPNESSVDTVMSTPIVPNETTSFLSPAQCTILNENSTLLNSTMVSLNNNTGSDTNSMSHQLGQLNTSTTVPVLNSTGQTTVASVTNVLLNTMQDTINNQNTVMLNESNMMIASNNSMDTSAGYTNCSQTTSSREVCPGMINNGANQLAAVQYCDKMEMVSGGVLSNSTNTVPATISEQSKTMSTYISEEANMQLMVTQQNITPQGDVKQATNIGSSGPAAPPNQTVLTNQIIAQTTNICTLSKMSDAELIDFINPATFE